MIDSTNNIYTEPEIHEEIIIIDDMSNKELIESILDIKEEIIEIKRPYADDDFELEALEKDLRNVPKLEPLDWKKETYMRCPDCGWEGYIHEWPNDIKCPDCYNKLIVKIKRLKYKIEKEE